MYTPKNSCFHSATDVFFGFYAVQTEIGPIKDTRLLIVFAMGGEPIEIDFPAGT